MRANRRWIRVILLIVLASVSVPACSSGPGEEEHAAAAAAAAMPRAPRDLEEAAARVFDSSAAAAVIAPHGGAVLPVGSGLAHVEVLVIPDTGQLVVYVLDKDGQPGKRIAQPTMLADVETSGRLTSLQLEALPEAGERVGDASRFSAQTDHLLRAGEATITVKWVLVDGQVFADNVVTWTH